jgi:hypothetical protein
MWSEVCARVFPVVNELHRVAQEFFHLQPEPHLYRTSSGNKLFTVLVRPARPQGLTEILAFLFGVASDPAAISHSICMPFIAVEMRRGLPSCDE